MGFQPRGYGVVRACVHPANRAEVPSGAKIEAVLQCDWLPRLTELTIDFKAKQNDSQAPVEKVPELLSRCTKLETFSAPLSTLAKTGISRAIEQGRPWEVLPPNVQIVRALSEDGLLHQLYEVTFDSWISR